MGGNDGTCGAHCTECVSGVCKACEDSYFLTSNNACFKYECGSEICIITKGDNTNLSLYRYNLGERGLSNLNAMGINVCTVGKTCSFASSTPICVNTPQYTSYYTGNAKFCTTTTPYMTYSGCSRVLCNKKAADKANAYFKGTNWHVMNQSDLNVVMLIAEELYNLNRPMEQFCSDSPYHSTKATICGNFWEDGNIPSNEYGYRMFPASVGIDGIDTTSDTAYSLWRTAEIANNKVRTSGFIYQRTPASVLIFK